MLANANTQAKGDTLTAIVTDANSNTISGVKVTFRISSGIGAIIVTQSTTDATGTATAVLTSGGNATFPRTIGVTATAAPVSASLNVNVVDPAAPPVTPASVSALTMFASAAQLFDDADTAAKGVTLTAVVTNAQGNVISGVPVSFAVTAGPAALVVSRDTTDATGTAVAILTTNGVTTARNVTITASVTSGGTTFTAPVTLPVIGHPSKIIGTISGLRITPSGSLSVTARAEDANANPVGNVPITFVVTGGSVTPATMTTNASGATGTAIVRAGAVPVGSIIHITMTAPGASAPTPGSTASADILVVADVATITLRTTSTNLKADADTVAKGVSVTAVLADANGALLDTEQVNFSLNNCAGSGASAGALTPGSAITDSSGNASSVVTTGGNATFPRTINVRAVSASNPAKCSSVALNVVDPNTPATPPANVSRVDVFAGANQLFADADTAAKGVAITAVVTDSSGNTLTGVNVGFSITTANGALEVTRATTDSTGTAAAILTTGGNTAPRNVTVRASVPTASVNPTSTVTLPVVGHAATVRGTLSTLQLPSDDSAPVTVHANAVDASANPVANAPVTFFVSSGAITGGSACPTPSARCTVLITDSTGQTLDATISTGGVPTSRTITVTMTAPGATADSANIAVQPAVATVDLTPATGSLFTDASTVAQGLTLSAIARDASGSGLAGQPIIFAVSNSVAGRNGLLQSASGVTDASGRATVVLTVGSALDTDLLTVTATYHRATGTDPSGTSRINVVGRVAGVALTSSSPQLDSSADVPAKGVTITAIVRDGNNNLVTGVSVRFVANRGALQITRGVTDSTGTATAILTTGGVPINQIITVTATAESASSTIDVAETGTRVTVSGADGVGSGQTQTYTVTLVDAANAPLSQRTVTLSVINRNPQNTLSATTVTTGSAGTATFTLTGRVGGAETITATALGATGSKAVTVSAFDLSFVTPASTPIEVNFGTSQTLTVRLRQNGSALAGETILFSATRGALTASSAMTDAAGQATVSIMSNGAGGAGLSLITATGPTSLPLAQRISTSTEIEFVATTVASIDAQAEPATVAATTSTTTGTSTITAVVRDPGNNPVKNRQIDFQLGSTVGGSLSRATATTDSFGQATTIFTAGTQSSASNGVTVTATDRVTSLAHPVQLTVGGTALFIALGTGNTISETTDGTSYVMPWTAVVTDSNGNAAPASTQFRLKVLSVQFQKGSYVECDDPTTHAFVNWCPQYKVFATSPTFGCLSEDVNGNGILDAGEDTNHNGKLDPGDVAVVPNFQPLTDGRTSFTVVYPKSYAFWVEVKLQVIASVAGTETTSAVTFVLPALGKDVTNKTVAPPGTVGASGNVEGPYGITSSCASPN